MFVSLDECAFSEKISPIYGYATRGTPAWIKTSGGWTPTFGRRYPQSGSHYSLLLAIFSNGRKEYIVKKGSIKRHDLTVFIDSMQLDASYVITLDNAATHKNLVLQTNPILNFTPAYSPEYAVVELAFANIKNMFRKANGRNGNMTTNIVSAINMFTPKNAMDCFQHVETNFIFSDIVSPFLQT